MIVVADTSPINYLVLIDEIDPLPYLFGRVILPSAVSQELQNPRTSAKVSQWVANLPPWAEVRSLTAPHKPELVLLDPGEREAIQLALELGVDTLLLDDADGRQVARHSFGSSGHAGYRGARREAGQDRLPQGAEQVGAD